MTKMCIGIDAETENKVREQTERGLNAITLHKAMSLILS